MIQVMFGAKRYHLPCGMPAAEFHSNKRLVFARDTTIEVMMVIKIPESVQFTDPKQAGRSLSGDLPQRKHLFIDPY